MTAQQFEIDTIQFNGSTEKFINLVFLGDGYEAQDMGSYVSDVQNASDYLFTITPFKEYRDYFNVFAIKVPSAQTGTDHPGTATDVTEPVIPVENVNTHFDGTFDFFSIHRLLVATNYGSINSVIVNNAPFSDQTIILINSEEYGGSGGGNAVSSVHSFAPEIVAHEMGHSFGGLSDEYYAGDFYAGENINMTRETDPTKVKWKDWIGEQGVGIYQHCCGDNSAEWYRPHESCKMRALGPDFPFCPVCREAITERIHNLFGIPIAGSTPVENSVAACEEPIQFSIASVNPEPNTLETTWRLNGLLLSQDVDDVVIATNMLLPGANTLSVTLFDNTAFVRDEDHQLNHVYTHTWTIHYEPLQQPDITLSGPAAFCASEMITLTATHAAQYEWNTGETTQSINVSTEGEYIVTVTNAYGCTAIAEPVTITVYDPPEAVILPEGDLEICIGDTVVLSAYPDGLYEWNNGSNVQFIEVAHSGTYMVTVTDENGCTALSPEVAVIVYPLPVSSITVDGPVSFCEGDSVLLSANLSATYVWGNGETSQSIFLDSTELISLIIIDSNGCVSTPDSMLIEVHAFPDTPVISFIDDALVSSSGTGNQWILNGKLIDGATDSVYAAPQDGIYELIVTNSFGCSTLSEPFEVSSVLVNNLDREDFILKPNPNDGTFILEGPVEDIQSIFICDARGQLVFACLNAEERLHIPNAIPGTYTASLITMKGVFTKKIIVQ